MLVVIVTVQNGDGLVRQEGVGAILEHGLGELLHDGLGLQVQMPHHGVAVPATKHLDKILVDFAAEECHGSSRANGLGAELSGANTGDVVVDGSGALDDVGDVTGFDCCAAVVSVVGGQGCFRVGSVAAGSSELSSMVFNDADGGHDRAAAVVTAAAVHNHVIHMAVLLGGESVGHCGAGLQFVWGAGPAVELAFV